MRFKYSLATMLLATAIAALGLSGYRYVYPPTPYPLPIYGDNGTMYFNAFGQDYVLGINDDALARSPSWNPQRGNPPLAVRSAMIAADKLRLRMIKEKKLPGGSHDNGYWKLVAAQLIPITNDRWCWEVRFQYMMGQGPPHELIVPVLMDGTVVEPAKCQLEMLLLFSVPRETLRLTNSTRFTWNAESTQLRRFT